MLDWSGLFASDINRCFSVFRSQMCRWATQKRTVVRDALGKHTHLESLEDTPEALQPDALQQHLHQLLQRYCEEEEEEEDGQQEGEWAAP